MAHYNIVVPEQLNISFTPSKEEDCIMVKVAEEEFPEFAQLVLKVMRENKTDIPEMKRRFTESEVANLIGKPDGQENAAYMCAINNAMQTLTAGLLIASKGKDENDNKTYGPVQPYKLDIPEDYKRRNVPLVDTDKHEKPPAENGEQNDPSPENISKNNKHENPPIGNGAPPKPVDPPSKPGNNLGDKSGGCDSPEDETALGGMFVKFYRNPPSRYDTFSLLRTVDCCLGRYEFRGSELGKILDIMFYEGDTLDLRFSDGDAQLIPSGIMECTLDGQKMEVDKAYSLLPNVPQVLTIEDVEYIVIFNKPTEVKII